jgi:mannose-6-phosphate isomerase-like protein (cupin superfamily)
MAYYYTSLQSDTLTNSSFRQVLHTTRNMQIGLMCLDANVETGDEEYNVDQFFYFVEGYGQMEIDDEEFDVREGEGVIVFAGSKHNILNTSANNELRFFKVYSPPQHSDGTIHQTKEEAEEAS